jgi:hypothetical protein
MYEYGNKIGHINIVSQTEALNSLQVIHNGTYADPAVAFAYRSDDRSDPQRPAAYISMVLDMSGSMTSNRAVTLPAIWLIAELLI